MNFKIIFGVFFLIGFAVLLQSCSSTEEVIIQGAGETFRTGMAYLRDGAYDKAKNEFDIVVKQYPASAYADSAQYYLAETYYDREEFLTAAFEYQNLIRNYPTSRLAPQARFQVAKCYEQQSPRVELDQDNTSKAIDAFQSFIDYYPTSPLVSEAEKEIMNLRNKLAEKDYAIAQQYQILGYYKAATVYYDEILDQYHDSGIADKASIEKVKVLMMRKKDNDAKAALEKFYIMFPNSALKTQADDLARQLNMSGQVGVQ
ncbi:MAG TPA: outer membrane protein assembly factor BamD [Candidatus Kryptonia bacterium]